MPDLQRYDVHLLTEDGRDPWSMTFQAESFAHAEEQAKDALKDDYSRSEIVKITRDY